MGFVSKCSKTLVAEFCLSMRACDGFLILPLVRALYYVLLWTVGEEV